MKHIILHYQGRECFSNTYCVDNENVNKYVDFINKNIVGKDDVDGVCSHVEVADDLPTDSDLVEFLNERGAQF